MEEVPNMGNVEVQPTKKGWSSREKILLVVTIILLLLCAGLVSYYLITKDPGTLLGPTQDPNENSNTEQPSESESNGLIKGTLGFPGEMIPAMQVCAVSQDDVEEICVNTNDNEDTFEISVPEGSYLIYGITDNFKAYYTECDTYADSTTDPRCNSNLDNKAGSWNDEGFICYEDSACKAAFTPLAIEVKTDETVQLKRLLNGWYIPCSDQCNSEEADLWQNYL